MQVAQRVAQLQEALLHCGKFQDALEPLLSWLADTEELISNQKPPSAEYKVVKAQIQEQKVSAQVVGSMAARQYFGGPALKIKRSWDAHKHASSNGGPSTSSPHPNAIKTQLVGPHVA